jgi:ketosteroid isomerase-like protein
MSTAGARLLIVLLIVSTCWEFPAAQDQALGREFAEIERRRSEALRANDANALERLYAADFIGITAAGRRLTRDAMIANVRSRGAQTTRFVAEDLEVRRVDELVLVTGRIIGRDAGGIVSDGRFLHMYRRHHDAWQIIAAQATPIAP